MNDMIKKYVPVTCVSILLIIGIIAVGGNNAVLALSQAELKRDAAMPDQIMMVTMISNALIALAYASIPVSLAVFVNKRKDIPFSWIFILFSAFILACGATHALHFFRMWRQVSIGWLEAFADSLTALISVASAVVIWPLLPKLLALPSPEQLRVVNHELELKKNKLEQAQDELRRAYAEVEQRVTDRTAELLQANQSLQAEIAERQQAESQREAALTALRTSEEKLSALFASMTEMVVLHELVLDEQGKAVDYRITDCNQAYTRITGVQRENAVGKLGTEVYGTPEPPYLKEFSQVALNGNPYEYTTYFEPMDKHFAISVVSPGKNRFATVTTDITAVKQIQEVIASKNKELENYLYVASHDLRSPLVNIQGFSQRLQKSVDTIKSIAAGSSMDETAKSDIAKISREDVPKALDFINASVIKMDTLISGLLQISRTGRQVMNIVHVDMNRVIGNIVKASEFQINALAAVVNVDNLSDCYGDENMLNQLFSNLIGNALKHRSPDKPPVITITSNSQYNKVVYAVTDNGVGIAPRHLPKIWDVFFRANPNPKEPGEGLGLSIVKRIVDRHKGKAWVVSEEGQGSIFYVELLKNEFAE